jgi:O-antigen/teichoic acid export membrane protein
MSDLTTSVPRSTLYNALASGLQVAVAFALVPIVIAHGGEAGYGLWVLLSTLTVTGLFAFLDLGLVGSVVKWVADASARGEPETAGRVLDVSLWLFAPIGLAVAGLLLVARPMLVEGVFDLPEADRSVASGMIAGLALQLVADFLAMPFAAVVQSFLWFGRLRALQSLKLLAFAGGSIALLRSGHGVAALPWLAALLAWLHLPALVWLARRALPGWRPRLQVDRNVRARVVRFSGRVFALRVVGAIYASMDKLILGAWIGTVAVKDYDVVFKLHALALMPVFFVTPLIVPLASGLSAHADTAGLRRLLLDGSKLLGALCLPCVVGIFALAEPLLVYWVGPGEAVGAPLVRLFVVYLFFWPFMQVGWNALIGHDRVGPIAWIGALSIAANLVLSLWLVATLGLAGVILATVVPNAVAFACHLRLQLTAFELGLGRFVRHAVVPNLVAATAGAGSVLALATLRPPGSLLATGLELAVCVLVAWGVLWCTGMDARERGWIVAALRPGPQRGGPLTESS